MSQSTEARAEQAITALLVEETVAAAMAEAAQLRERLIAAEMRLTAAIDVYRAQRAELEQLRAQLNARPNRPAQEPVVTTWTDRFGCTWEKTRVGNRATSRLVSAGPAEA